MSVTEALQYPEYSCVASYKRLAVGCAFLVPDSNRNEAYISFILTRPEWRRAGIATFMLYHLLQVNKTLLYQSNLLMKRLKTYKFKYVVYFQ